MTHPDTSLLICANQRSGSFLLCRALADTGVAGIPDEYFLANDPEAFPDWGFWEAGLFGHVWGARDAEHYLELVFENGTTPNGVFGAKMMWNDTWWVERRFRQLPAFEAMAGRQQGRRSDVFQAALPNLRPVLLTRRDRVRQAVSWARAAQEGVWEVRADQPANPQGKPVYDEELIGNLEWLLATGERGWRSLLADMDVNVLEIVYEEMAADVPGTVRLILDHLNLSSEGVAMPEARTIKQADDLNDEWADRFRTDRPNRPS